jgi:hypothetical protein
VNASVRVLRTALRPAHLYVWLEIHACWLVEVDRPCVEGRQLTVWLVGDSSWCAGPSDEASLQFAASEGLPRDPREMAAKAWSHEAGMILTRRKEIATDLDRVASKRDSRELTAHCFSSPLRGLSDGAAKS